MILLSLILNQTEENVTLKFRNLHAHDGLSIKALQRHNAILTSMTICLERYTYRIYKMYSCTLHTYPQT